MRSTLIFVFVFVFALAFGCGKKDDNKSNKAKPTTEQTKPPEDKAPDTPKPPEETKADTEEATPVTTEADFEEEASKDITKDNLEKEVGAMEKELEE